MNAAALTDQRYDHVTIVFHWATAILVAVLWVMGQTIDWFPRGTPRISARSTHILLGALLLGVACARIFWRLKRGARLPAAQAGPIGVLAKVTHTALYVLLVATVLLGVLNAWSRGDKFFALFTIPKLVTGNAGFKGNVEELHALAANVLLSLAGAHAMAALLRHFVKRDGVLQRMLK